MAKSLTTNSLAGMPITFGLLIIVAAGCSKRESPALAPPRDVSPDRVSVSQSGLSRGRAQTFASLGIPLLDRETRAVGCRCSGRFARGRGWNSPCSARRLGEREKLAIQALSDGLAERAEQGKVTAQWQLGYLFEVGAGLPKDLAKAVALYQKAAGQGFAQAQCFMGDLYRDGKGVPKDVGKAIELFEKAASQGLAQARNNLARLYETGTGVKQNLPKAVEFYQEASDQGLARARYTLGSLYVTGKERLVKTLAKQLSCMEKPTRIMVQRSLSSLICMNKGQHYLKTLPEQRNCIRKPQVREMRERRRSSVICMLPEPGLPKT